jgi:hypothetical protein
MDGQRERLATLLGSSPSLDNVPASYWDHLRSDLRGPLITKLIDIYLSGANTQADEFDHTPDPSDLYANALVWASNHVDGILDKFIARSQEMAVAAVAQFQKDNDEAAMLAALVLMLGDTRAESIAITELTSANTAGERRAAADYAARHQIHVEATWHTEEDSKVCPVCRPLDGTTDDVWRQKMPNGPPGHPRCRCWLTWAVIRLPLSRVA